MSEFRPVITVQKINETKIKVRSDFSTEADLSEYFSFFVDGYKFNPKFKARLWDGKIRLYHQGTKLLAAGLFDYVKKYAADNDCDIELIGELPLEPKEKLTYGEVAEFIDSLNLTARGVPIEVYDYQIDAVEKAINRERILLLSATGSGKSLIIYSLIRWILSIQPWTYILIIVPTTGLVKQMLHDFADYSSQNGWDTGEYCQFIMAGQTKDVTKSVTISTWQSLTKQDARWFNQFQMVIGDEAHLYAAQSLTTCMEKMTDVVYRIGTTGTIKDSKCLPPWTLIHTKNKIKKINEIKNNDLVLSFNCTSKTLEYKKVNKVFTNFNIKKIIKITLKSGSILEITDNHEILTERGYIEAKNLSKSDKILSIK